MAQSGQQILEVGRLDIKTDGGLTINGSGVNEELIIISDNWAAGDAAKRIVFVAKETWVVSGVSASASTVTPNATTDFTVEKNNTDAVLASALSLDAGGAGNTTDHVPVDGILNSTAANLALIADDFLQITLTGAASSMVGAAVNIRLKRTLDVNP